MVGNRNSIPKSAASRNEKIALELGPLNLSVCTKWRDSSLDKSSADEMGNKPAQVLGDCSASKTRLRSSVGNAVPASRILPPICWSNRFGGEGPLTNDLPTSVTTLPISANLLHKSLQRSSSRHCPTQLTITDGTAYAEYKDFASMQQFG